MTHPKTLLVVIPTGCALVLITAAFASEAPPPRLGPTPPLALRLSPAAPAQGPSTTIRATLFAPAPPDPHQRLTEADLSPALDREPVRRARALADAGRFTEALGLLTEAEAQSPQERFLRALVLLKAGRAAEAAPAFLALVDTYPALADRSRFLAAKAFERAGDLASAAGAYDAVAEGSLHHTEAQFALAQVLRRSGDARAAAAVLAPFAERPAPPWGWDVGGDALFELAQAQEAAGQAKKAAVSYLRVWSEHAASRRAETARLRAGELGRAPTEEQVILHAEGQMERHRNQRAVDLVAPLVEAPPKALAPAAACLARYVLGKSYRKLRQHAKAVEVLDTVVRECEREPELWGKALYIAATSATFSRPAAAIGYYRTLAQQQPDSPLADDALFGLAELLTRADRPVQARIALQRIIKLYPDGDQRPEAMFQLFWLERAQGRPERGLKVLERLGREYAVSDPVSAERARYWRGRTLVDAGRVEEGLAAYAELVRVHPASFYALLARTRLAEVAPERALALADRVAAARVAPAPLDAAYGVLEGDPRLLAAVELLRLGLPELARDELVGIDRTRLRAEPSRDGLRLLVTLLGRTGEVRLAHAVARNELRADLSAPLSAQTAQVWRIAFPLAFREFIDQHSPEAGVDPDLLQALIREESALDPKVHSWAGAIGLCQLMMPTAREVAGWLKVPGPITPARLYDPDLNLRMGATYLGRLLKQFKGNVALSLASYNAGAGAVGRWVKQAGPRDLDEFIEEIPVAETRNYVKRVLKTYAAYQYVYGPGPVGASLGQRLVAAK